MKIYAPILTFFFLFTLQIVGFANPPEKGLASYYSDSYHGRKTATGERYDKNKRTAAHKTLPFGTKVRVYNPANKKSVVVVINDRGPYIKGRIIELSRKAALEINLIKVGVAKVELTVLASDNKKTAPSVAKSDKNAKQSGAKNIDNMIDKAQKMEAGGLYKMQVLKLTPQGFGVQVAGYSDYQSVVQQLAVIQNNWFKGANVYVDQKDNKPYYKVILGPLNTREEAQSYCTNIKEKYAIKDAFVVDLKALAKPN